MQMTSRECEFCGHFYIQPCDAAKAKTCLNVRKGEAPAPKKVPTKKKVKKK